MKSISKILKRTVATFLSLMIVVSALSGALTLMASALVSDSDYEIVYPTKSDGQSNKDAFGDAVTDAKKASVKGNVKVTFSKDGGTTYSSTNVSQSMVNVINDGLFTSSADVWCGQNLAYFDLTDGATCDTANKDPETVIWHEDRVTRVTLPLKGSTNVESIVLALHNRADLRASKFAVFASNTEATLFSKTDAMFYKNIDNTSDNKQLFNFKFGTDKLNGVKYIGLEVYCPDNGVQADRESFIKSMGVSAIYARIMQFDAYGTVTEDALTVKDDNTFEIPSDIGTSVVKASDISATFVKNGATVYTGTTEKNAMFVDNNLSKSQDYMALVGTNSSFYDKDMNKLSDMHFDIVLPIKSGYKAEKLLFVNTTNNDNKTGEYEIYASASLTDLFASSNLKYTYKNTSKMTRQLFTFGKEITANAKYIGVRITDPITDSSSYLTNNPNWNYTYAVPRIYEANVYGTKLPTATVTSDDVTTEPTTVGDKLTGTPVVTFGTAKTDCTTANIANINDGDAATAYAAEGTLGLAEGVSTLTFKGISDGKYFDAYYNFGKTQKIKAINITSVDNSKYYIGSFAIYAANDKDTLFDDENLKYTVSTTGGKRHTLVSFASEFRAQYVGIRTDDVCDKDAVTSADEVYLRLAEFSVWGKDLQKSFAKTTDDNSTPTADGKDSVVKGVEARYTHTCKGTSNQTLTSSRINQLIDGIFALPSDLNGKQAHDYEFQHWDAYFADAPADDSSNPVIHANDGKVYVDYIETLYANSDVEEIVVTGSAAKWATSYELYISDKKDTLFDADNKVATHNNVKDQSATTKTQVYSVSGYDAGYVGLRVTAVTASSDYSNYNLGYVNYYPHLYEFNVYGTKGTADVAPETGESVSIPSDASIVRSANVYFYNGTERKEVKANNTNLLFDKSVKSTFATTVAQTPFTANSDSYADVVLTLKGSCKVNAVYIANALAENMRTGKYSIYLGDANDDTLFNKAYYTFDNTEKSRIQSYTVDDVAARYVAIRIFNPVCGTDVADADKVLKLCEANVFGTVVTGDNVTESGKTAADMPTDTNLLTGRSVTATIYDKTNGVHANAASDTENITDGNTGVQSMCSGNKNWWIKWSGDTPELITDGSVYVDVVWTLNGTASIDKLYFCGALGNGVTQTGEFYVYASDSFDTLDQCEVAHVDNTALKQEAFTFTFSEPLTGIRYVKLRVTNPINSEGLTGIVSVSKKEDGTTADHNVYPRINEFGAYGSIVDDPFVFQKVVKSAGANLPNGVDLTADGVNHISEFIDAKAKFGKVVEGEQDYYGTATTNPEMNSDGVLNKHYDVQGTYFAKYEEGKVYTYNDNTKDTYNFCDLYYNMLSPVNLKYLVFSTYNGVLAAGKYDVFISDTFADLYSEDNIAYVTVDNAAEYAEKGVQNVNVICFEEGTKAQFIGIRLYNPITVPINDPANPITQVTATMNNIYPRISEFAVYGNYVDPTFNPEDIPDVTPTTLTDDELNTLYTYGTYNGKELGKNLLLQDKITLYMNGKLMDETSILLQKVKDLVTNKCYKFIDGVDKYTHNDFYDMAADKPTYIFRLTTYELTQIDGFVFMGNAIETSPYLTSEYSVFVAEDLDDLFLAENRIYHYDPVGEDYTIHRNQMVTSNMFERKAQGCYIAFQIDNPNYTGTESHNFVPRMSYLYAWGQEAVITPVPTNMLENMPVTAQFVNGNKYTEIPESNLSASGLKKITDATAYVGSDGLTHYKSNLKTSGSINTKGTSRNTVSLNFNLCGDMNITSIGINTVINSTTGFKTMKVYGAKSFSDVYTDSALIWTWNAGSKTGNNVAPSYKISKNVRYVRFVFEGTKDKLQFNTIEVIGYDSQKMKTRNLTGSLATEQVEYYRTTKNDSGKYVRSTFTKIPNAITEYMIDGFDSTWANFGYGYVDDTFDVLIYLGDLRTVSKLDLMLPDFFRDYYAKNINVYFGETIDVINSTTPNYKFTPSDFKKSGISAAINLDIRPVMARYIRLELKNFPKLYGYREVENGVERYCATSFFPDIKLTGTKVSGMQRDADSEVLYTVKDKASGINVSILRLDTNDVYDKVTSVKVKKSTASNWQMRSVQTANMLVVDKTVYEIELYDFYGEKVTNIDDRYLQIGFNTPSEFDDAAMVADASVRTTLTGLDTTQTGKISWSEPVMLKESDNKYALLGITTDTDPYWDTIGELENFAEGDLAALNMVNGVIRSEDWFDSLHAFTTDGADKLTMKPVDGSFEPGVQLVTTDISASASDDDYYNLLSYTDGKKIAAFYNLALVYQGDVYDLAGQTVDVNLLLSDYVKNNYTDLQIFQTLEDGTVVELWSQNDGNNIEFQTNTMGNIAIIGTALDGSSSIGIANGENTDGITSPATGENTASAAATILLLMAAGFVVATTVRKGLKSR